MKKFFCLLYIVSFYICASDQQALQKKITLQHGFFADFNQTILDKKKRVIAKGNGHIALQKPNQLYWHIKSPNESLILSKKNQVAIVNPDLEQLTLVSTEAAMAASPMTLLVQNNPKSWNKYTVKGHDDCFNVFPKDKTSTLNKFQICFDKKQIASVTLFDAQGVESQFVFSKQRQLKAQDKRLFNFSYRSGKNKKYSLSFYTPSGKQTYSDFDVDDQRQKKSKS